MNRLLPPSIRFLLVALFCLSSFVYADDDVEVTMSPEVEAAIKKGLAYIADSQQEDGSWKTRIGKNVGENSLALMALMASGNLPGEGEYGDVVAKGLDWVMEQQKPSGLIQFTGQSSQAAVMYGHALATLMLSEVWGQSRRADVGEKLRAAVELILQVQGPKGGWGYKSKPHDGDTSVCVMQLFAIKSAYEAGIYVPGITIEKALKLIKTRYDKKKKGFGYNIAQYDDGHKGSSAAGACIMFICGEEDPLFTNEPAETHFKALEQLISKKKKPNGYVNYFLYYGTVAAYYSGGDYYKKWKDLLEKFLLLKQGPQGDFGNYLYNTSFSLLALSMPYRYIPIYQH